jgi:hypothetical protein
MLSSRPYTNLQPSRPSINLEVPRKVKESVSEFALLCVVFVIDQTRYSSFS